MEMNYFNRPEDDEGAEGCDDEVVISDTPIDEDDFLSGLDRLDDAKNLQFP
ncbi:Hypothetical predicted protein [Paramuricea clavata]|uniref:Uncharacterized protein n=1 Tax=Paramuricea clavata TaxID=317549 RepID=A0A6S7J9U5_PARCT|nr:Hypothetical predicted protein [Paramuricea clavata]